MERKIFENKTAPKAFIDDIPGLDIITLLLFPQAYMTMFGLSLGIITGVYAGDEIADFFNFGDNGHLASKIVTSTVFGGLFGYGGFKLGGVFEHKEDGR